MNRFLDIVKGVVIWGAMFAGIAGSAALAVLLWVLGKMVDPTFYALFAVLVGGLVGIGAWLVWEVHRTRVAARDVAEERLVDPKEVAEYRPPTRRRDPRRWLRYIRHGSNRIKEGVSQR